MFGVLHHRNVSDNVLVCYITQNVSMKGFGVLHCRNVSDTFLVCYITRM